MADKTDLNIVSTDPNGKKQTTKISYVNPEASATQLYQLATKLMDTSQNTYQESSRVDTTEITDESGLLDCYLNADGLEATNTATKLVNKTTNEGAAGADLVLYADAQHRTKIRNIVAEDNPYIVSNPQSLPVSFMPWEEDGQRGVTFYVACGNKSGDFEFPASVTVGVPAKDGYKSAQATFTFSNE